MVTQDKRIERIYDFPMQTSTVRGGWRLQFSWGTASRPALVPYTTEFNIKMDICVCLTFSPGEKILISTSHMELPGTELRGFTFQSPRLLWFESREPLTSHQA